MYIRSFNKSREINLNHALIQQNSKLFPNHVWHNVNVAHVYGYSFEGGYF